MIQESSQECNDCRHRDIDRPRTFSYNKTDNQTAWWTSTAYIGKGNGTGLP